MNPVVEKFKNEVAPIGYSPEDIRAKVRECAEYVIDCAYNRAYWDMRDAMEKMSFEELMAILAETKEGGLQ